ncbi:putative secreted protein with long stretch of threonines mucin [Cryptosporidium felis]|nr:putative secreted protein with long stretch of threonines mucin [Cryptosporidium felis]
MRFALNESQFQRLEAILNDDEDSRGLECNAMTISQYLDILFGESEEPGRVECSCGSGEEEDAEKICKERALLFRIGFSVCMRTLKIEGFSTNVTIARVIRVLKRLLKAATQLEISCTIHREMMEGLSVIFGMVPDFNIFKVIQNPLKSYLFWCYTQSEDDFVITNSRILLCVTTWMKEPNSSSKSSEDSLTGDSSSSEHKSGLTSSSQDLLNLLISDIDSSTQQLLQELKLVDSDPDSEILSFDSSLSVKEIEVRILRNLQLFSKLIFFAGVYKCSNFTKSGNNSGTCEERPRNVITTVIVPQIIHVLESLRLLILEEIYGVVDCFLTVYRLKEGEKLEDSAGGKNSRLKECTGQDGKQAGGPAETRVLTSLIYGIIVLRFGSKQQRESLRAEGPLFSPGLSNKILYTLELASLSQEILEKMLSSSGKTGLAVYSHMIQEYLGSLYSLEYVPSSSNKFRSGELTHSLLRNYFSSLLFGFGVAPRIRLEDYDFQIFLSFGAGLKILDYFDRLFEEIIGIQQIVMEAKSDEMLRGSMAPKLSKSFTKFRDVLVSKKIISELLEALRPFRVATELVLGLRQTRAPRDLLFLQEKGSSAVSLDQIVNKCHISSSRALLNFVTKDSQILGQTCVQTDALLASDTQLKEAVLELTRLISGTIAEYYQDSDMVPNLQVFKNMTEVRDHLLFILDHNLRDEQLTSTFDFFRNKVLSNPLLKGASSGGGIPPRSDSFLHTFFCDFSDKEELLLDYRDENWTRETVSLDQELEPSPPPLASPAPPSPIPSSSSSSSSPSSSFSSSSPLQQYPRQEGSETVESVGTGGADPVVFMEEESSGEAGPGSSEQMEDVELEINMESSSEEGEL